MARASRATVAGRRDPLRGKALREAITAPAQDAGVTVERELTVQRMAQACAGPLTSDARLSIGPS